MSSIDRRIVPMQEADLPSVGAFLAQHFGADRTSEQWRQAIAPIWCRVPDCGYVLRADDGRVGGVIVLIRAERAIGGERRRTCSLSSWLVLPEFRDDSIQLLVHATRDRDIVYVNFTPAPRTARIFERLGFQCIDTTEWVMINVPYPWVRAVTDPTQIASNLTGRAYEDLVAHAPCPRLHHVGIWADDRDFCHVSFIRGRFHLIPTARVLYASDWNIFRRALASFGSAVLVRFGLPMTMVEQRRIAGRPTFAVTRTAPQLALFRGAGVAPDAVDGLYSELVTFA